MAVKTKKITKRGIKSPVLKQVKGNTDIVSKIISATGKSYPTVMRWLTDNSTLLTQAACLNVICSELNLKQSEVLA